MTNKPNLNSDYVRKLERQEIPRCVWSNRISACSNGHVVTPSPVFSHGMSTTVHTNYFYCKIY